MSCTNEKIKLYTKILHDELKAAMGCTEPIAIAYCSAYAIKTLGKMPDRFEVSCSGNIIKNVKAVTVPQTGGLKGIEAAVLAGAVGGNADKELEVLSNVTEADITKMQELMKKNIVQVKLLDTSHSLHILINCFIGEESASVEIIDTHTGIGNVTKNGKTIKEHKSTAIVEDSSERRELNLKDILEYGDIVNLEDVRELLERQIKYNTEISSEGLENNWGARVGQTLLKIHGETERARIVARAAAGSDARMNGCAMPVVINSGSGNQGMTVSLPVIEYAKIKGVENDKLLRGLCVSNLTAIHQKTDIGRLSAFCGAVSAATGAAVGIAYLEGASYEVIAQTITNSLGTVGGMVCDGAKSSCASKIATAVECALLGYDMAKANLGFESGEGIINADVEKTIANVGRMAAKGMHSTDIEVLNIMIEN